MVDFKKELKSHVVDRPVRPADIYERLDRASDKGPLRPVQHAILERWYLDRRAERDVILKLHTGQGKTLIGLLILQSRLNENLGRALYLCPNNFLVNQTLLQAAQFGIKCAAADEDGKLPAPFIDGEAILVAPVQKLFNGMTRFGIGASALELDSIVVDDAHACTDAIKDACTLRLERKDAAYQAIIELFAADLGDQGTGTYAEIRERETAELLPVPYWAWMDRHKDVASILARHSESKSIRFVWPLIRDNLRDCRCVVSGREMVVAPYMLPIHQFGSYAKATHRVYMSATVTDDSFLIKGFGIDQSAIEAPLVDPTEKWSGEKMVLIPSLIDEALNTSEVIAQFAASRPKKIGVVVLVPSFDASARWKAGRATIARAEDIDEHVERLRDGERDATIVIANRYDGIDLPDATCRILIIDGKPYGQTLLDRYEESCRPGSRAVATRVARTIEQGMGRAVRGEKDYCVIILTGGDLVHAVRTKTARAYLSNQTRRQIEIGLDIAGIARPEIAAGTTPANALLELIRQSLNRDEGWKEFYTERMNAMVDGESRPQMLDIFALELRAEQQYSRGDVDDAVETLQSVIDRADTSEEDAGWYLQDIARYTYSRSKSAANKLQLGAHKRNRYLLKPNEGMSVSKLAPLAGGRLERIRERIARYETPEDLALSVEAVLGDLRLGVRAENFERALDQAAGLLGFTSQRPDKEWKSGPDNLWALRDHEYMLFECKSEVEPSRESINKDETGQLNNSVAWFAKEYPGADVLPVMIIATKRISVAAGFNQTTGVMRKRSLSQLTYNIRAFFSELGTYDLRNVSDRKLQELLSTHSLDTPAVREKYTEAPDTRRGR